MLTREKFDAIPEVDRESIAQAVAAIYGEESQSVDRAWGDGKFLEKLQKLLAIFIQFAPLFLGQGETDRKLGDGTLLRAFLNVLSNPEFIELLKALFALKETPVVAA